MPKTRKLYEDILFRGKDINADGWHYGIPVPLFRDDVTGEKHLGLTDINGIWHAIKPDTLCQSTGKQDGAGKLIYEGDVVIDGIGGLYTVRYSSECAMYELIDEDGFHCVLWPIGKEPHKVVGNIFDGVNGKQVEFAPTRTEQQPEPKENTRDAVNHPAHYNTGGIEVIDAIEAWGFGTGFNRGNAIKYLARAGHKDGADELEDLKKALFYLEREVKRLEGQES